MNSPVVPRDRVAFIALEGAVMKMVLDPHLNQKEKENAIDGFIEVIMFRHSSFLPHSVKRDFRT